MTFSPEKKCPFCHKAITDEEIAKRADEKFVPVCDKCKPVVQDRINKLAPLFQKMNL